MKKIQFLIISLLITLPILAQNTLQTVNSSGLNLKNSSYTFDISIGESIINTQANTSNVITQGYLQPWVIPPNSILQMEFANVVKAYPNPFTDLIKVESRIEHLNFCITDVTGRIVFNENTTYILSLSFLSDGIYSLLVSDKNNNIISVLKICKSGY